MHRMTILFTLCATLALPAVHANDAEACGRKLMVSANTGHRWSSRSKLRARKRRVPVATSATVKSRRKRVGSGSEGNRSVLARRVTTPRRTRAKPGVVSRRSDRVTTITGVGRETTTVMGKTDTSKGTQAATLLTRPSKGTIQRKARKGTIQRRARTASFQRAVYFGTGAAAADSGQLTGLVKWLEAHPDARIVIEGHTDASGSAAFNQPLSVKRARAVRDQLVESGSVSVDRVQVRGFGESRIAYPDSPRKNRRVVIRTR